MQTETYSGAKRLWPTFLWALFAFCMFGLLAVIAVRYYGKFESYPDQRARERSDRLATLRAEEEEKLSKYGWVDKQTGVAHIPVERAMELVQADLSRKEVKPSAVAIPVPGQPAAQPGAAVPAATPATAPAAPEAAAVPVAVPATQVTPATTDTEASKPRPARRRRAAE